MRVCVFGLWHLGSVTAACLAGERFRVVGLDQRKSVIGDLSSGHAPVAEPGLDDLLDRGISSGLLSFSSEPAKALSQADVLWVTFDTPLDGKDRGNSEWLRRQLDSVRPFVEPNTLILMSSQVPVGFTDRLQADWRRTNPTLQFACSPENLRLGRALDAFRRPERVVLGAGPGVDRDRVASLLQPFTDRLLWMSLKSAEMTKHALNGFLAVSVTYANDVARLCERAGADAAEVELGLRTDRRVGEGAYVSPGPAIAGGTLLRDVRALGALAATTGTSVPLIQAVPRSNNAHRAWLRDRVLELIGSQPDPCVAILGLTYKPGTNTLRRSASLDLARWLSRAGVRVQAFDPAIARLRRPLPLFKLAPTAAEALAGS
ncbi:MAG: UDP-glucose/GDP-mannose dehydrogenase family protein, partial [Chloroflexota bacterium]|nr:UDP-glucose/GDP-mannose dehydrogenase family protein [Chloroflexota bacterium]